MRQQLKATRSSARQRGITLIESLVAIVVMALGVLGILGVQMRTLTDTQTTVRRAQAIRLIEDLGERMKVNPNALADLKDVYVSGWNTTPTASQDCVSATCSHAQLAAYDLREWKRAVARTLPLGDASIFLAQGETGDANRRQLGVMISWRENERSITDTAARKTYKDSIDATKIRATDGSFKEGGGTTTCPEDRSCHLQYIPVAARCAPYFAGAVTTPQFFCPGT